MRNIIPNYNFGKCLKHLYSLKNIDTNKRGWAVPVACEMFDNGILSYNSCTDINSRSKQRSSTKKLLQNHLNVSSAKDISGQWLTCYCEYFDCSADYLMGYIEKSTYADTDIYKETGLDEKSIQTLREIQKTDIIENTVTVFPSNLCKNEKEMTPEEMEEFTRILLDTPEENIKPCPSGHVQLMDLLNFLLSCDLDIERLLKAFRNLTNPYTVPVFYDNKKGWIYPDNEYSKDVSYLGHSTYTINLASDEKKPDDNLPIWITKDFLDNIYMKSIENIFHDLCNEYRNQNKS